MMIATMVDSKRSPLEDFLRDYVASVGGEWDEIEPLVYDLLLPSGGKLLDAPITRVTFDPDALSEHRHAQLASLGTPFIDGLLQDAVRRARFVDLHLFGLNLHPHGLTDRVKRSVKLESGLTWEFEPPRVLDFPQAIFWFEATFLADQQEQEIVPVAIDLASGRSVRHIEDLLRRHTLSTTPGPARPAPRLVSRKSAYRLARDQAARTVASLANQRRRELTDRVDALVRRMTQYYADLRDELTERGASTSADLDKRAARIAAIDREQTTRIDEIRRHHQLRVRLRLLQLAQIHQPKLVTPAWVCREQGKGSFSQSLRAPVSIVWDPLAEAVEALECPSCRRPTLELRQTRSALACSACVDSIGTSDASAPPRRFKK